MARLLLLLEAWEALNQEPLAHERAMLLDFAVQHPQAIARISERFSLVTAAHGLQKADLSDLLGRRSFGVMSERFAVTASELVARGLLTHSMAGDGGPELGLTAFGREQAQKLSSAFGGALRAIFRVLATDWRRKNLAALREELYKALPDDP
ncbi:unnamed protein product, partial [Laminaria digitata]